jgi:hypothetical protein
MNKKFLIELTEKETEVLKKWFNIEMMGFVLDSPKELEAYSSILEKVNKSKELKEADLINSQDLFDIVSNAKREMVNLPGNLHLSNKKVEESNFRNICVASATIMWLNGRQLLKNNVNFDYTDHSCEYEQIEE